MVERLRGDRAISSTEKLGVKDGVQEEDRMANVTERLEELQGAKCRKRGCLRCPERASSDRTGNSHQRAFCLLGAPE